MQIYTDMEKTLSKNKSDNPKLKARTREGNRLALFLEYYLGYTTVQGPDGKQKRRILRRRDFLELYLYEKPKNNVEREENRTILREAHRIRVMKENERLNGKHGYTLGVRPGNFHDYYRDYIERYTKKDKRNIILSYSRFSDFLEKKYPQFVQRIQAEDITRDLVREFVEYLQSRATGSGANTIFARFKKVVKDASMHDFFVKNPCEGITCKIDENTITKDILSEAEILQLAGIRWPGENMEIRRAFIFSLYTGTRFCDVETMKFANIDYSNKRLTFEQNKTRGHSKNSRVDNPINTHVLELVGPPGKDPGDLIFKLPSHDYCNRYLREWTKRAGITKRITWHSARHTFGTLVQSKSGNINTTKKLLGHSSVKHTEKYARASDEQGREAVEQLPDIYPGKTE